MEAQQIVYLALRHTSPSGFFKRAFASFTKARLVTRYPHSGIVINGMLYEATFKNGVHCAPFDPKGWDLYKYNITDKIAINRFESVKGSRYDWFSLLAFVLPFKFSVVQWLYCYELCFYMATGEKPTQRITPEDLLRISNASFEST
jgi:hypothetical protein